MNLDRPEPFQVSMIYYMERNLHNDICQFEDFPIGDQRNIVYEAFCNADCTNIKHFSNRQCLSFEEIKDLLSTEDTDFLVAHWESPLHHKVYMSALNYFQPEILETIDFVTARLRKKMGRLFKVVLSENKLTPEDLHPGFDVAYGAVLYD